MIYVNLNEEQRQELEEVSRRAVGRVALRAQMVLLSGRNYSVPQIADIHDCGREVVRQWLHRYEDQGVAGLEDERRRGRPPNDPLAGTIIEAQASQSPRCSGYVQSCWSVALLGVFLATRFGLVLSGSSLRRYLHMGGWRWRRPRLEPAHKSDEEAGLKQVRLDVASREAVAGKVHLLYLDECDLHLLPVIRAMWMKGRRPRVPTPGKNDRHAFFGALDAVSGAWLWTDADRKLAVYFVEFLKQIAAAYPDGMLYLALDNAPIHTARVVQKWADANPRVELLWLPRYAAHDYNPVERIWGIMKSQVAANRLAGSIEELTAEARRFFRELAPYPLPLEAA